MKKITVIISAFAVLFCSCNKETADRSAAKSYIKATTETAGTKAIVSGEEHKVLWSEGDQLVLFGANSEDEEGETVSSKLYNLVSGSGTTTGTFEEDDAKKSFDPSADYYMAMYPVPEDYSGAEADILYDMQNAFTWPRIQKYSVKPKAAPMLAEGEIVNGQPDGPLVFYNLGGYIKINVSSPATAAEDFNLTSIKVSADQYISGLFNPDTIDDIPYAVICANDEPESEAEYEGVCFKDITYELGDYGYTIDAGESSDFYIAIPELLTSDLSRVDGYTNFTVEIYLDGESQPYKTFKANKAIKIERSAITSIPIVL